MFKKYDAYNEATKNAQVNRGVDEIKWGMGYMVINLLITLSFLIIGYYIWSMLTEKESVPIYKTKVMSATHTIDENEELMFALEQIDVGSVDTTKIKEAEHKSIENALSEIINNSEIENEKNYLNKSSIEERRLEEKISAELKSIN